MKEGTKERRKGGRDRKEKRRLSILKKEGKERKKEKGKKEKERKEGRREEGRMGGKEEETLPLPVAVLPPFPVPGHLCTECQLLLCFDVQESSSLTVYGLSDLIHML